MNKDLKKFFLDYNIKQYTSIKDVENEFNTLSRIIGGIKSKGDILSDDILELESYSYFRIMEELENEAEKIVLVNPNETPKLVLVVTADIPFNVTGNSRWMELHTLKYDSFVPHKSSLLEDHLSNLGILSKRKLMTIFDKAIEVYGLDKDNLIIGIPYVDKNPTEKTFLEKTDYKTLNSLPDNYNIGVVCEYVDQKDIVSL